jgi:hypothetical protein
MKTSHLWTKVKSAPETSYVSNKRRTVHNVQRVSGKMMFHIVRPVTSVGKVVCVFGPFVLVAILIVYV